MFTPSKTRGGGGGRVLPIATITNQSGGMMNKYVPGSGVGASNIAARRRKSSKATPQKEYTAPSQPPVDQSTVPNAPVINSVTPGYQHVAVYFSIPNNGGSRITSYTVTSSPGDITATGTSSPITVNGLTNGTQYTFTIIATNEKGDSAVSNTSDPAMPNGEPPSNGIVRSAVSFYDDANPGYTPLYNTLSKMCSDSNNNIIAACYARDGTFHINATDAEDGITQTETFSHTFTGDASVAQNNRTYYLYNIEIVKYNSDGLPQWVAKIGGNTNRANTIYDIVSDSNNNIYVLVGHGVSIVTYYNANGSVFGTINNAFSFGNFSPARYCIIKYNASGEIQWINSITAGDNNNAYVLLTAGNLIVDNDDNVYMTSQVQRAGGGSGPTSIKFYEYASVDNTGVVQFTLTTSDSYPFNMPFVDGQWQRGFLIKINPTCNYDWIARMVIPGAYGEQNGGPINKNIVIDSDNNVYVCVGSITSASSPICNIYSGVSASTSPLPTPAASYYRLDLRGNSLTPSTPQYYKFAAIVKFNSSGAFQRATCAHQLHNSSVLLDMNPFIGINKTTNSLYMSMNAQGFTGTNTMSGALLNKLYVNNFTSNTATGPNYNIIVSSAYTLTLMQPQSVIAIVQFDSYLQAQNMAYIHTPGGNSNGPVAVDSNGNVYVTTTIKDSTITKTIYTYNSLSGSDATFNEVANINATSANTDGLVVAYTGDLTSMLWAAPITSTDGLNNSGFSVVIDNADNIYVGGTASLNPIAETNYINLYNYTSITGGFVTNTLFGSIDVTNATDKVGIIVKYT